MRRAFVLLALVATGCATAPDKVRTLTVSSPEQAQQVHEQIAGCQFLEAANKMTNDSYDDTTLRKHAELIGADTLVLSLKKDFEGRQSFLTDNGGKFTDRSVFVTLIDAYFFRCGPVTAPAPPAPAKP